MVPETVSESITVGVSNIIETPPSLTLPPLISVVENTSVVTQASATDPEGSTHTYALSGTDARARFMYLQLAWFLLEQCRI